MANVEPHIHELEIRDRGWYWAIEYGDQTSYPDKPSRYWFWIRPLMFLVRDICALTDEAALRAACRRIIAKHDRGSRRAPGHLALIERVREELQPKNAELAVAESVTGVDVPPMPSTSEILGYDPAKRGEP